MDNSGMTDEDYRRLIDCMEAPLELKPEQLYVRKGLVGSMDGFDFKVYSNDHGLHFHVIHKSKNIDARFSYPSIDLESYKTKNVISRKEINNIKVFFSDQKYFDKLTREFEKRSIAT